MPNRFENALQHYGSWSRLLELVDNKIAYYLQIPQIYHLMEDGGLHPSQVLHQESPAYFSDAVAFSCLNSYDASETDYEALERCLVTQLHKRFTQMEKADRTVVPAQGSCWEQYVLDSLLRLVWRCRGKNLEIPFYLHCSDASQLTEAFLLTVADKTIALTNNENGRTYEVPIDRCQFFSDFSEEVCRCFRLATEENGCFVPEYVWLVTENPVQPDTQAD